MIRVLGRLALVELCLLCATGSALASDPPLDLCGDGLGPAAAYNVFVTGDFDLTSDVEGWLAAGGTASLSGFSVGFAHPGGPALVVDDLDARKGQVYGDGFYAGAASTSSVTFLGGSLQQGAPLDFAAAGDRIRLASSRAAALSPTATPQQTAAGNRVLLAFDGSDPTLNVFQVSAAMLSRAADVGVRAPAGSTVVINVTGNTFMLGNTGFHLQGVDAHRVIWNFVSATTFRASSIGWKGSILAPYAHVQLDNGNVDGSVFAASAGGSGEWHHVPFDGVLPCDAACGDGTLDSGEQCDDGNTASGDGCDASCMTEWCGDGIRQKNLGEQCDDGNNTADDGCGPTCQVEFCGDGIVQAGEQCDDGNSANDDGCSSTCAVEACGDGVVQTGEQCDDGNTTADDGCGPTCAVEVCGDGIIQPGEQCDDGNAMAYDGCAPDCTTEVCGDGIVQPGEQCDDGNTTDDDGCTATCALEVCGDGIVQSCEQCDDGNTDADDGCGPTCAVEACGDGVVQSGEQCDDGNTVGGDGCGPTCAVEACGDGIAQPGEQCDDGNTDADDGCGPTCQVERCGDGVVQSCETCDDGNTTSDDGCSSTCFVEACGDGIVQTGEQCDDGNTTADDGCGPTCATERCGDGVTQSGEQCDDGNTAGSDGCGPTCQAEICGDGIVQAGEDCDDGNADDGDGCDSTCLVTQACADDDDLLALTLDASLDARLGLFLRATPWGDRDLELEAGAWLQVHLDGTATLHARAHARLHPTERFDIRLHLWLRGVGPFYAGDNGPVCNLPAIEADLFVATWTYFDLIDGEIVAELDGSVFILADRPDVDFHPLQLGVGANDVELSLGLRAWFDWYLYAVDGTLQADGQADLALSVGGSLQTCLCGDGLQTAGEACDDGNLWAGDGCSPTCAIETDTCGIDLDFQVDAHGGAVLHGERIEDIYAALGIHLRGWRDSLHLLAAAVVGFDSEHPSSCDPDLGTPNSQYGGPGHSDDDGGATNVLARGTVAILADDLLDLDLDGLIDLPGDLELGGILELTFDDDQCFDGLELLDIDLDADAYVEVFDRVGHLLATVDVQALGDNSWQYVPVDLCGVARVEVHLDGGGALAALSTCIDVGVDIDVAVCGDGLIDIGEWCDDGNTDDGDGCSSTCEPDLLTCDLGLDFDLDLDGQVVVAGSRIEELYAGLGIHLRAWTDPLRLLARALIAFDTSTTSTCDPDLGTPNGAYGGTGTSDDDGGLTNVFAQANVLVMADDLLDLNLDGLIDLPNDAWLGGVIDIDFDSAFCFAGLELLDVQADGDVLVRLFDAEGHVLATATASALGDNSWQYLPVEACGVVRAEVRIAGEGAIAGIDACPDPDAPVCGNGVLEIGEECDDGNLAGGDDCSATCEDTSCLVPLLCSIF